MLIKIYFNSIDHHITDIPILFKPINFPVTIGRAGDNTIVLSNDSVSGHHAQIEKRDDGFFLVDLKSTNGIFYNKKKIEEFKVLDKHEFYLGEIRIEIIFSENAHEKTRVIDIPSHFKNDEKQKNDHRRYLGLYSILIMIYGLLVLNKFLEEPLTGRAFAASLGYVFFIFIAFLFLSFLTSFPRIKQFYYTHLIILLKAFCVYFAFGILVSVFAFFIPAFLTYQDLLLILAGFTYLVAALIILRQEWNFNSPWQRVFSAFSIFFIPVVLILWVAYSEKNDGYSENENLVVGYPWIKSVNYDSTEVLNSKIDKMIVILDKMNNEDK